MTTPVNDPLLVDVPLCARCTREGAGPHSHAHRNGCLFCRCGHDIETCRCGGCDDARMVMLATARKKLALLGTQLDTALAVGKRAVEITEGMVQEVKRQTARADAAEAEVRRLRSLPPDCYEHADNCCRSWCATCQAGAAAELARRGGA